MLAVLAAAALWAQNGSQFREHQATGRWAATEKPVTACGELRQLTGYGFTVASAVEAPAAAGVPAFCRVLGQVLPEVQFEISLPSSWNRRLYMFGNGGYAGENLEAPSRVNHRNRALHQGFAVAQTNTGHEASREPLGTFAYDRQKLYDYAFRAVHVTVETAKELVRAHYGKPQERAYFDGCSTGGRQALISAQRFPRDFDGILAGAPVLNFSGTMISYASIAQALEKNPLPTAKLKLLADKVYEHCDATDGLRDGLIEDPRACGFRPERDLPRCAAADQGNCFTSGEIATLQTIYSDVLSNGQRIFPGWPAGAEAFRSNGRSAWENWLIRDDAKTISATFGETFFRYLAYPEKDPDYVLAGVDFDKDPARLAGIQQILDATDPDLTAFRARGGKLLMYFGWADPALNAQMGVDYYETVLDRMGAQTPEFFRLFMVPGMFHCAGGVGPSSFDGMTALMQWVEEETAPAKILALEEKDGKPVRARPLCAYPAVARYRGQGSLADAASYACEAPAH